MSRLVRMAVSFCAVACVYLAYAALAVPRIEPPAAGPNDALVGDDTGQSPREPSRWRQELTRLLVASDWPQDQCPVEKAKVLASIHTQLYLVFGKYDNLGDGRVKLSPCVVLYTPKNDDDEEQATSLAHAIVLDAPQGAVLEFHELPNFSRMRVDGFKLKGGVLTGRVTVHSQGKHPGLEDDLLIATRDIQLDESQRRVWTQAPLDFRFGASHGRGRGMAIRLLSDDASGGRGAGKPSGIESVEIGQLEQLHLELDGKESASRSSKTESPVLAVAKKAGETNPTPIEAGLPIEVSCRGPCRFEPIRQQVTFEDRVNVMQLHPDGPCDQMQCDKLSLYLARPRAAVTVIPAQAGTQGVTEPENAPVPDAPRRGKDAWNLEPRRIEARGNPVVITATSEEGEVRCTRLDYDFQSKRIVLDGLDGAEPVLLKQGNRIIRARTLDYLPGDDNSHGQVVAHGPGELIGQMDGADGSRFRVTWGSQLQIRPVGSQQVVSLTGGAEVSYGGFDGSANEIHLYLSEASADAANEDLTLRPDSLRAEGNVTLRTPQLVSKIDLAEVWFKQAEPTSAAGGVTPYPETSVRPAGYQGPLVPIPRDGQSPGTPPAKPRSQLAVAGKHLQAQLVLGGPEPELSELILDGNVELRGTPADGSNVTPIVGRGDRIRVTDANGLDATATITGSPARFEGQGLLLSGANINLNSGSNRLWIDGPGRMDLPLTHDLSGQPLAVPARLAVQWQKRMTFNGRTARFEQDVVAASSQQTIRTETLEVDLDRPIRFDQPPKGGTEVKPRAVRCHGDVTVHSESVDARGRLSLDQIEIANLQVDLASGVTTADGPGRMTTVRRGLGNMFAKMGTLGSAVPATTNSPVNPDRLGFLGIQFLGRITGNVHHRQLTFHDQVRAVYGPVDDWIERLDPAGGVAPERVLLDCQALTVSQTPLVDASTPSAEMAATGNVVAEGQAIDGQLFTARAARMSYSQAKGLFLMEGDGRSDARLSRQQYVGAPYMESASRQIWFWPETNRVHSPGLKSLNIPLPYGMPGLGRNPSQ